MGRNYKTKYDLDGPWSIGSEDYKTLLNHTDKNTTKVIVELGSGVSTFQLANDFPDTMLRSFENDSVIAQKNESILHSNKVRNAKILYSPIKLQFQYGGVFLTYDIKQLNIESNIDLLIIDGPVERLFPMGREAALYFLYDKLSIDAVIGLDDYHRKSSKTAVVNWLKTFGNSLDIIEETKSFVVLKKVSHCAEPGLDYSITLSSYKTAIKTLIKRGRRTIVSKYFKKTEVQSNE